MLYKGEKRIHKLNLRFIMWEIMFIKNISFLVSRSTISRETILDLRQWRLENESPSTNYHEQTQKRSLTNTIKCKDGRQILYKRLSKWEWSINYRNYKRLVVRLFTRWNNYECKSIRNNILLCILLFFQLKKKNK